MTKLQFINHTNFNNSAIHETNELHSTHNDPYFTPHHIRVDENTIFYEQTTKLAMSRGVISYNLGESEKRISVRTAELDSLAFLSFNSSNRNLFKTLIDHKLSSKIIKHFADCEDNNLPYNLPNTLVTGNTIIKRVNHGNVYRFYGSIPIIQRIVHLDSLFFTHLLKGIKLKLCYIARVDLATDLSEDFMDLVSSSIKGGRVHTFGSGLRGYGTINGLPLTPNNKQISLAT